MLLSGLGAYVSVDPEPGLYGATGDGAWGAVQRLVDTASYFTIWSNVVVAVSATLLWRRPGHHGWWSRVLRLDALLMITVTAIVYQVLLAPSTDVEGWSLLTDPWLHVVTPLLTVVVWLVWGPRGWVTGRVVPAALLLPLAWIAWMLGRGAVVGAYPYGFANVEEHGYGPVAATLAGVLVFGVVVAAAFWGLDRLLQFIDSRKVMSRR